MTTPNPSAAATGTVTLHRVLRAPAERIYRAFLDPMPCANGCHPMALPAGC